MKHKLLPALAAGVVATMALPAVAQVVDGPTVNWNVSTWGNPRAFTDGIEKAAELVAERTEGRFTIRVHYGEALSAARENLDGIQIGAFEGAMFCNFYHPGKNPAWMVLTMPFLPLGDWDVSLQVREELMQHPALLADMERWGAVPYMSALLPQYEFMGRGTPPQELSDWSGKRVRAGGGLGDAMATLGATLTTVPATEVYTGIERGTMDAASFPYTYSHAAYQIHTIADWFTSNMQPGTTECGTVFAKRALDALPEAYRELLMEVKDAAYEAQIQAYIDIDEVNLPMFRERLTEVVYTDDQLREFQERAGRPVWDQWVQDNQGQFDAQELLDFTLAAIERAQATN